MAILDKQYPGQTVMDGAPFQGDKRTARQCDMLVRTLDMSDVPALFDAPASPANRAMFQEYKDARMTRLSEGPSWYGGCKTRDDVDALIRNGWPEGAKLVKEIAAQLTDALPPPASIKRRTRWADEGDELDRDKLDRGEVDTMWRTSRRDSYRTAPQTLSVACSWGGSCAMSAEQLKWGAAAMVALSDILEEAGYNVELFAAYWNLDSLVHIRVKRAGEALAVDSVMAMIGHAGIYRTYGIGSIAAQTARVSYGWGFNKPCEPGVEHAVKIGAIDPVDIMLPHIYDKATAEKECKKALAMLDEAPAEA